MRALRPLTLLLAVTLAIVLVAAPAAAAAGPRKCQHARALPAEVGKRALLESTVCLVNKRRAGRGMRPLRIDKRLSRAARRHARDMVRRSYFSHTSLGGATFLDRIRRTGYTSRVRRWLVGENLAWGSGSRGTPLGIVRAWMGSPGHRANILRRGYRHIGIGMQAGAPAGSFGPAATYVHTFGARS